MISLQFATNGKHPGPHTHSTRFVSSGTEEMALTPEIEPGLSRKFHTEGPCKSSMISRWYEAVMVLTTTALVVVQDEESAIILLYADEGLNDGGCRGVKQNSLANLFLGSRKRAHGTCLVTHGLV